MTPKVLSEDRLRDLVGFDLEALAAVEEAFRWLADGRATVPPILHIEVPQGGGDVDVKSAVVEGLDSFAIKMASGFAHNAEKGLATGSGLMVVLSAETGFCQAVLLDNGYLTDLRTALAGAVAAKYLAPRTFETAGVIGTGVQARLQIRALRLVRDFRRLVVWGRTPERVEAYRRDLEDSLGVEVVEVSEPDEVLRRSRCAVTTTSSREPLVTAAGLHPGLHITAVGSDFPGKQELSGEILQRADLVACDLAAQVCRFGELQHLAGETRPALVELGGIVTGRHPGRGSEEQVTICDLTGVGVQDTAISLFALGRAGGGPGTLENQG